MRCRWLASDAGGEGCSGIDRQYSACLLAPLFGRRVTTSQPCFTSHVVALSTVLQSRFLPGSPIREHKPATVGLMFPPSALAW
jgi:hypothetical protein